MNHNRNSFMKSAGGGLERWLNDRGQITLDKMRPMAVSNVVTNGLLTEIEWSGLDAGTQGIFRTGDYGIPDLIAEGLSKDVGGLGTIFSGYGINSDMEDANISMDGVTNGDRDRVERDTRYVPIPIFHKDYAIKLRELQQSRMAGVQIETDHATEAALKVRDQMRYVLFNGWARNVGGRYLYGFTNQPQRITDTATNYGGGDFGTAGNAYKAFVGALEALVAAGFNGPFGVYVSSTQYSQLQNLYGNTDNTELAMILAKLGEIKWIKRAFSADLPAGEVVFVQLTSNVIDVAIAQDVTNVQWDEKGGFITEFRVMAASAARIKQDYADVVGVLHMTGA